MQFTGYDPYLADPDLWMRLMKISINDFDHYEYALIYINDVLTIGYGPTEVLQNTDECFGMKTVFLKD